MNIAQQNRSFFKYLNRFYYLSKLDNEYDLISSNAIVKKCVLIEKNNIFFASKSLNLSHHSLKFFSGIFILDLKLERYSIEK